MRKSLLIIIFLTSISFLVAKENTLKSYEYRYSLLKKYQDSYIKHLKQYRQKKKLSNNFKRLSLLDYSCAENNRNIYRNMDYFLSWSKLSPAILHDKFEQRVDSSYVRMEKQFSKNIKDKLNGIEWQISEIVLYREITEEDVKNKDLSKVMLDMWDGSPKHKISITSKNIIYVGIKVDIVERAGTFFLVATSWNLRKIDKQ